MGIALRSAESRGHASHGWLDTNYTFSFADYHDPAHMGYRNLRVMNDDTVKGASGFPTHGHANMEIITYVTRGALAHKDSTGGEGVIRRGDVQTMSAGTGVRHSEFNASRDEEVKLYQIWILPQAEGLPPAYAQANFSDEEKHNKLRLLVAPKGAEGALPLNQDVRLYASVLDAGAGVSYPLKKGRGAWVQVVDGAIDLNGVAMKSGDGAAIDDVSDLQIKAQKNSEFLLFDLN
ncbi:MAG: pirin family protein [Alphaproteobacteria bacterium]